MEDRQFSCIAAASCTSKATVSKVLNHCYGVSSQVRSRVFTQADRMQADTAVRQVEIYTVFPESPVCFKQNLLRHPKDITVKYNVYSHLQDEETLLRYLEQAETLNAKVILVAAWATETVKLRLQALAQKRLVILLAQYGEVTDCFYVGSDPKTDGKKIAELSMQNNGKWLVVWDPSVPCLARLRAFSGAFRGEWESLQVEIPADSARTASVLARQLSGRLTAGYCGVVCLGAYTGAVCAAIRKLKLSGKCLCVGMGDAGLEAQYAASGLLKGAVYVDYPAQLEKAMALAQRYVRTGQCPDRKYIFTESEGRDYL